MYVIFLLNTPVLDRYSVSADMLSSEVDTGKEIMVSLHL